jgi:nucleoside-diphosphate-sugar epimerase
VTVAFVTGGSGYIGTRLIQALRARGDAVYALARSDKAAKRITNAGAEPVKGDIEDPEAVRDGMRGAEVVFHLAAKTDDWARPALFEKDNVEGTKNVLWAMPYAGVERIVHVSPLGVLWNGAPVLNADETLPTPLKASGWYLRSKLDAEREVLAAAKDGIEPVVVRLGLVWGPGEPGWVPRVIDRIGTGRFKWVGTGKHLISTTHVANAAHGLVLAGDRGRSGEVYFVTDGAPVEFRAFLTRILKPKGIAPPDRSTSPGGARFSAKSGEFFFTLFNIKRAPGFTRSSLPLVSGELTVSDAKARAELGYEPVVEVDEGLRQLRSARRSRPQSL